MAAPLAESIAEPDDAHKIAREIHRRAIGADRPFIVCERRRRQSRATVRSAPNYETGMGAAARCVVLA